MRVLIVEDDHRLASSLRRNLGETGIVADAVHDGEEGLEAARTTAYDVIVLDVMLPGLDGLEVSRRMREARVHTPILMLTARDSVDDRVRGLESGADDYLVKPFAMREVVARIRALARRHLPQRSGLLRAGKVTLDTGAHVLRVDGNLVELSTKEFAVLEYFLLNQGRLLTRGQIIEHVWDYDFDGGRNLIEVYVGRLRRKLIEAGGSDPFVTVRGSGYRYESGDA
jgi:DNA-binding response OmpR family regulator